MPSPPHRIATVVGARPQFIKASAVSRAMARDGRLSEIMIHTGQHFDANMSQVFFDELEIPPPAHNLDIHGGGHGQMTGRMLEAIERVLLNEQPRAVLVYGDTNSTLAGALAAVKLHLPVIHVEAGLRSYIRTMPEEVNRVLTDHVSEILLCPTAQSVENLRKEGIARGVHHIGDVMYDATLFAGARAAQHSRVLETLELAPRNFALATVHRAENTDDPARLRRVLAELERAGAERPVIWPVHPRTRAIMQREQLAPRGVRLIEPLGYLDIQRLLAAAAIVYTDSGGLQKEAYFNRVPCVTLRDETEWVETVDAGWNRLWTVSEFRPRREITDYGDGRASERIVDLIAASLASTPAGR